MKPAPYFLISSHDISRAADVDRLPTIHVLYLLSSCPLSLEYYTDLILLADIGLLLMSINIGLKSDFRNSLSGWLDNH